MVELGPQELVALSAQLEHSNLQLEMLAVHLVQLVKALQLHTQHVLTVALISTVQMQETPVLPVWQPVKLQMQPVGRLNVVS